MQEENMRSTFGKRFYQLRADGNMGQEEFARFLGISSATVGFYENANSVNGRMPKADALASICKKCGVSSDWLLGLSDVRSPDIGLRQVCDYTGLSERAANTILSLKEKGSLSAFDAMVSDHEFECFVKKYIAFEKCCANAQSLLQMCREYIDAENLKSKDFFSLNPYQSQWSSTLNCRVSDCQRELFYQKHSLTGEFEKLIDELTDCGVLVDRIDEIASEFESFYDKWNEQMKDAREQKGDE